MGFMKPIVIYEKNDVKIYINQCHVKGKKTNNYVVRMDDKKGYARLLGRIVFYPRWWQYVFEPKSYTIWTSSCMKPICDFLDKINESRRVKRLQKELKKDGCAN